jgi:hypothetical protein
VPPKASSASSPCSAASHAFLTRCCQPSLHSPDPTPDSRHLDHPRDSAGRGTALWQAQSSPARLRAPRSCREPCWHDARLERLALTYWRSKARPRIGEAQSHSHNLRGREHLLKQSTEIRTPDTGAPQPLRPHSSGGAPCPCPGRLPRACSATGRPNTGDKLRSGARVRS